MGSRGKISPSVQTLRDDSQLALSVCSIHEMMNSDPDVEQTYMSQDQGPYAMTPVQELKPPLSPNTHNPTLEQNVIKSVSLDSVMCTTRSNKHRSRPQDGVLDQHTPDSRMLEQRMPEGTVLEQFTPEGTGLEQLTPEGTVLEQLTPEGTVLEQLTPEGTVLEQHTPEGTVLEQHTPEGTVLEQHTPEGTVLEQHTPDNSRKQDDTRDAAVVIHPQVDPVSQQITDQPQSMCTVAHGLLSTSGFVWIPLCKPGQRSQTLSVGDVYLDARYEAAQQCTRHHIRRNALADPMKMAMKQETRERIQKEVAVRKTSVARKVSQYFKAIVSDDYEVDLI